MLELRDVVKQCRERLERFQGDPRRLGEQNTKASLISPIIEALGWDLKDPDEVCHEYRRNSTDNPVDYALLLLRTPRLFIEAKGLGKNLDVPRWANQTIAYATAAGVEWVALTDGMEWRVYNAHAPVPIEQKLFGAVRIDDPERAVELLSLLSKDNMRINRIDGLWREPFVDRQVNKELTSVFSGIEPPAELVDLLLGRLPRLTRDEIRTSLIRARATFDFPKSAARQAPPSGTAEDPLQRPSASLPRRARPSDATTAGRTTRPTVSAQERRIKVADMIDAGRLRPGSAPLPQLNAVEAVRSLAHETGSVAEVGGERLGKMDPLHAGELFGLRPAGEAVREQHGAAPAADCQDRDLLAHLAGATPSPTRQRRSRPRRVAGASRSSSMWRPAKHRGATDSWRGRLLLAKMVWRFRPRAGGNRVRRCRGP